MIGQDETGESCFIICTPHAALSGQGMPHVRGTGQLHTGFWRGVPRERHQSEDLAVEEKSNRMRSG